ncbi:two-component response regulator, C4-dicarboxylate transport regulator [Azoarcus sp. CIB]|uniref:sigma-54-dependent transcriptional regulator n=1 Tax=Aromatoleum sp. (strain CIB) TaxID=198107 RepID=UPI00067B67D2|nr:sigma-54 dependent transcriptional regulator [Azoarcus sp. CIB]AKU10094.1 two-component response regulator, C4-dicarboxylate transport regulator [Azoarcus sp. CIB]
MTADQTLWLIEDDPAVRNASGQSLRIAGFAAQPFADAESALAALAGRVPDAVVSDVRLPEMDGIALMGRLLKTDPGIPVILITGHGDVTMAVQAMRAGAYDFIEKPFPPERLVEVVRRALEKRRLTREVSRLTEELARHAGAAIVGECPAIQNLRRLVGALGPTAVDVLLHGETGTGKEVLAHALHAASGRTGPFVAINCGGLPESVFESEMFGYEAGAFTGATKRRIGKIEYAHGGTLFLDEIESMPLALQAKLLRVLQDHRVERLGGNVPVEVDCRIVAATKEDLKALSDQGRFRADLYYRLNVAVLQLPPLRDRKEDIPLLMAHFLAQAAQRFKLPVPPWGAADVLHWQAHDWPGNVRELKNAAERICLGLSDGLPVPQGEHGGATGLVAQIEQAERGFIRNALKVAQGQVVRAAELLKIPRKTLYDKLARYGIRADDFREPPRAG